MRALTVHQPFASQIADGEKAVERRSWPTNYRGPLAIHAAKRPTFGLLPTGVILCVVDLAAILPGLMEEGEERWYGWILERPVKLAEPLAARGRRGLWTPDTQTLAALTSTVSGP